MAVPISERRPKQSNIDKRTYNLNGPMVIKRISVFLGMLRLMTSNTQSLEPAVIAKKSPLIQLLPCVTKLYVTIKHLTVINGQLSRSGC